MKRTAFTLLELLVVMVILGVLIAIILPAMRHAKEQGKRVVCLSNQRNLALAWTLYADDNDYYMCSPCPKWYGDDQECSWIYWDVSWSWPRNWTISQWEQSMRQGVLWDYNQKGAGVYRCPSGQKNELITYAGFASMGWKEPLDRPEDGKIYQRISEISCPSKRSVFIDEGMLTPQFYGVYNNKEAWFDQPPGRHMLGTTMSFSDTHAEYWKWQDYRTRQVCQLEYDVFRSTWMGVLSSNNYDIFKMKIAAWGNAK